MRLRNSTNIPNDLVKDLVRFARPPGIARFRVTIENRTGWAWNGYGGRGGIRIRINTAFKYPMTLRTYQLGQLRNRRYYLASITEALVYLLAHELMHVKQGSIGFAYGRRGRRHGRLRSRVWGARGKYSEIETESYAIRKLREWRRIH